MQNPSKLTNSANDETLLLDKYSLGFLCQCRGAMQIPPRAHLQPRVRAALASPYGPPVYLHGPPSTGKQSTLRSISPKDATLITIDCILCHTERQLFSAMVPATPGVADASALLDALRMNDNTGGAGGGGEGRGKGGGVGRTMDMTGGARTIFVFTRAERLASSSFPASTLPLLFRLSVMCGRADIRIVLVSRVPFPSVRHAHSYPLPAPAADIYFPPLSEPEVNRAIRYDASRLVKPLPAHVNAEQAEVYFNNFAISVIQILRRSTDNPHHLQRVADALFPDYVDALTSEKQHNPMVAFNRVRDRLTDMLTTLSPAVTAVPAATANGEGGKSNSCMKTTIYDDKTRTLPRAARVLLVSAYLATVIAPSHDMRHFSQERTGRRAAVQKSAANNSIPLERLLAIYHAVRPDDDDDDREAAEISAEGAGVSAVVSTAVLVHLSTLVALGWLVRDGGGDLLAEPKFRCKLSRDDAVRIAGAVGMHIHDYLVFDKS